MDCNIFDKQVMKDDYEDTYQRKYSEEEYEDFEEQEHDEEKRHIEFSGYVKCIGIDSESTLWLGTVNSGLIRFPRKGQNTVFHTDNSPIPDNDIYTIAIDSNDTVWAGSDNGLIHFENDNLVTFDTGNSLIRCNEIRSICFANNHILVGYNQSSGGGGISVFKINELK
jgi:hypothetical protein